MFHVKHFGTIGAENLTNPHMSFGLRLVGLSRKAVISVLGSQSSAAATSGSSGAATADLHFARNASRALHPLRVLQCNPCASALAEHSLALAFSVAGAFMVGLGAVMGGHIDRAGAFMM